MDKQKKLYTPSDLEVTNIHFKYDILKPKLRR
jgi:hypothetical protein